MTMKDLLYEKIEQRLVAKELDPKKSTRLAEWRASEHTGSFRGDSETLYVHVSGEYFLVYEGGMNAAFHDLPGVESWFGGSHTRPLQIEEALAWCEETGNYDAVRDHLPFFMLSMKRPEKA
ncbi:MAG TPA: hypothetical protein PK380_08980 [Deltaproteobacteria bacterium]|nr:hypothetical protein [Deltaproteobacteria bacterium]